MTEFKVGQKVKWTSQAGGYSKTKEGVVVFVLFPDQTPSDVLHLTPYDCKGAGLTPRGHTTYLVQIGASKNLSWPRVKHLQVVRG